MTLRSLVFWPHLIIGLLAGLVIVIMSATGVALTCEKQIIRWAERDVRAAAPSHDALPLPIDDVIARVTTSAGQAPSNVTLWADRDAPVLLSFGREGRVLASTYTGESLGEGAVNLRAFFRTMTDWHRWLGREGDTRPIGKAINGACNLAFLFLVVSGLYLWFPRRWVWRAVRAVTVPRLRGVGKAREWNWHNVLGFWSSIPLFVIVVSGAVISYAWAGDLVYRAVGSTPPAARGPAGGAPRPATETRTNPREPGMRAADGRRGGADRAIPATLPSIAVSPLLETAKGLKPNWTSISFGWPVPTSAVTFTVDTGSGAQPQHKTQVTVDAQTRQVTKVEGWPELDAGRRARSTMRFLHTGEFYGLAGQAIAGLASLAAVLLGYTGISLSVRRFLAARRRRRVQQPALVA